MDRNSFYNFGKRNLVESIKNKSTQTLLWLGSLWLKLTSAWGFVRESTQGQSCVCSGELTYTVEPPVRVFLGEWDDQP